VSVRRFDLDKKHITVEVVVPAAHFTGKYEVKGKLLSLPLVGKGTFDATFCECTQLLLTASPIALFLEWASTKTTKIVMPSLESVSEL
jgi:hypothetical protein